MLNIFRDRLKTMINNCEWYVKSFLVTSCFGEQIRNYISYLLKIIIKAYYNCLRSIYCNP